MVAQIIVQVAIKGLRPPMDPSCPEPVRRLISKCWAQDARGRPSCAEIMRLTAILLQHEQRQANGSRSPAYRRNEINTQAEIEQPGPVIAR